MPLTSRAVSHRVASPPRSWGSVPPPRRRSSARPTRWASCVWSDLPLDWTAAEPQALAEVPVAIADAADAAQADVVQVNLPSQAAGLATSRPVLAVAHSCVASWFRVVRGTGVPSDWHWQQELTARGLARADAVAAPSRSHADLMARCYPGLGPVEVVANATGRAPAPAPRQPFAYAAARWWDDGKNAALLDAAAGLAAWPVIALGATEGPQGQTFRFRHARASGAASHAEVRRTAVEAGVFVSPSLYEPFGLATLEAAQAGAALVLADIPTYRELWDGAALFADPQDPAAFAAALDRLADDAPLRRDLSARAGARAARCTPERQARAMLALYDRIMPAKARAEAV